MSGTPYPIRAEDQLVFTFVSTGDKGEIEKLVRFDRVNEGVFNLGFGDRIPNTLDFDENVRSDNGDVRKIFATIVAAIDRFFEAHADCFVFIIGSDELRMKLYIWLVKNNRHLFQSRFLFWGGLDNMFEPFEEHWHYQFLMISKIRNP